ncbi:hypothetical protein [Actinocrinis puniceicyclus]|nr:hypothetical protein [Actinocrinis puniceicyclus]
MTIAPHGPAIHPGRIATVDRKDFRIIAPAHREIFELLPADLERS